ncbi:hypothetical protein ACHAP5_004202 [Fusarium lateritium]
MALQQRARLVVRHKMARLETADSIFTASTNILSLFSWSSIKKTRSGSLLALFCWATPLVVVLRSETLSVVNGNAEELVQFAREDYATSRGGGVPRPKDLGVFQNEPIIWIGYAKVEDVDVEQPTSRQQKGCDKTFTPVIFRCEHYDVNYAVRFDYVRGTQSYKIKKRDYVKRPGSKKISMKTVPESNYVLPSDAQEHRSKAAYCSIGWGLRYYLQGSVDRVNN